MVQVRNLDTAKKKLPAVLKATPPPPSSTDVFSRRRPLEPEENRSANPELAENEGGGGKDAPEGGVGRSHVA